MLSHRVRLKTVLGDGVYPGLGISVSPGPDIIFVFTTLPPGAAYQTPPNLIWVWLTLGTLFRACERYRSWHREAKVFCSLTRLTLFLTVAGLGGSRKRNAVSPRTVENGVKRWSLPWTRNFSRSEERRVGKEC